MSWVKIAKDGGGIDDKVKQMIRSSPFFIGLFRRMGVPMELLDKNLHIEVTRLKGSFCEANDEKILIDDRLAGENGFFTENFHFIAHEMLHWLRRQKEKLSYFGDPEEVEGFTTAIAYEMYALNDPNNLNALANKFLPLIKINIPDDNKATEFLRARIADAKKLLAEIG